MWASSLLLSCPFKMLLLVSSTFSSNCFCCSLAYSTARRNLSKIFHSLQFCPLAFFIFLILGWALASAGYLLCAFKWAPLCLLWFSLALVRKRPAWNDCYDSLLKSFPQTTVCSVIRACVLPLRKPLDLSLSPMVCAGFLVLSWPVCCVPSYIQPVSSAGQRAPLAMLTECLTPGGWDRAAVQIN